MAAFAWGKIVIDYAHIVAKKAGMNVIVMHSWQEVVQWGECNVIPVMGVEKAWLGEVYQNLTACNFRIIDLAGEYDGFDMNISRVVTDQKWVIEKCIEYMKEHGRSRIALFGVQSNDTSDTLKADCFGRIVSKEDVFCYMDDIGSCFEQFLSKVDCYDGVICANDIVAVYLMSRCKEHGILIPDQLYLIGNTNLWIGTHIRPTLSTVSYNPENMVVILINVWKMLINFPDIHTVEIRLEGDIIERESSGQTNNTIPKEKNSYNYYKYGSDFFSNELAAICPEIKKIKNLNNVLSSLSAYEITILQRLYKEWSYEAIAAEIFLSVDTVKYHIKKLYRLLGIQKRKELIELLEKYQLLLDGEEL